MFERFCLWFDVLIKKHTIVIQVSSTNKQAQKTNV